MMTLTVSHHPSSFLMVGTAASADFTVGSIIRVNTPFLEQSLGLASYTRAVTLRQGGLVTCKLVASKAKALRYGMRSRDPVVSRFSSAIWACGASANGQRWPIRILTSPLP